MTAFDENHLSLKASFAALGYLVAAMSPSMEIANSVYPAYVVSLLFFVGLLIRLPDIPKYWKWNVYINPLQYVSLPSSPLLPQNARQSNGWSCIRCIQG